MAAFDKTWRVGCRKPPFNTGADNTPRWLMDGNFTVHQLVHLSITAKPPAIGFRSIELSVPLLPDPQFVSWPCQLEQTCDFAASFFGVT